MDNNTDFIEKARVKAAGWLDEAHDEATRAATQEMLRDTDPTGLVDAFYNDLEFGTGGLRGIMGVGSNRMNIYTVGAATQGFASYINRQFPGEPRAACVGYDSRHNSRLFAETVASIFSANGIDVYLFEVPRPTPEISFAIRTLGCKGGVIITASHNPKEYNGYKAYWDDGSQLVPPHDENVIEEVKWVTAGDIRFERVPGRVHPLGEEIDRMYLEQVRQLSLSPDAIRAAGDLKIVFTPLHGTTGELVPASLHLWGFTGVHVVPEQGAPDGDFPTVASANPEEPAAFKMALDLARAIDAELAMACDPDGDRIGIAVKDDRGEWTLLNGNQANLIFIAYIARRRRELGLLPAGAYIVKTIVTTELLRELATREGIACHDVYTGFKWIAAAIRRLGPDNYIGGGEESFGFMPGAFTRDKDGVASASLMAEIAAWCKAGGRSIYDFLVEIYLACGYSQERMVHVTRAGVAGAREIAAMMQRLRQHPPRRVNGSDVILVKDYLSREATALPSGEKSPIDLDTASDVLQFFLADGSKISARPSGTEPKIKFYFEARAPLNHRDDLSRVRQETSRRIDAMIADIIEG